MGVIGRRRNGNGASASDVCMTKLVRETLQLISIKMVVVPKNVVMARPARSLNNIFNQKLCRIRNKNIQSNLNALMRAQIKVKFGGMSDSGVNRSSGRDVAGFTGLFLLIGTEESCVMPLLDNDKRNARLVIRFQLDTSFSDGRQLVLKHSAKLAFTDAVTVHDDPVGFETSRLVEQDQ